MDALAKIKKLREMTLVGIAECKEALHKTAGDFDKALALLRERGARISEKKAERKTQQGVVEAYIHFSGQVGALVEVNCETDFVARTDVFKEFAKNLALHIAAVSPRYVKQEDVPGDSVSALSQEERSAFIKEKCLMEQAFVKDNSKTIKDYLHDTVAKTGENIVIRRFTRFALGEYEETT